MTCSSAKISSVVASTAAALTVFFTCVAFAQSPAGGDLPSVSVRPAESEPGDPNFGQWFVLSLKHGETGSMKARITNVADAPQRIHLYLADLVFDDKGNASVQDGQQSGVGSWGNFDEPFVNVEARQTIEATFHVKVPPTADPGDHVGVVVAESADPSAAGSAIRVVKRVATRLYVTVPGEATRSLQISRVTKAFDFTWWPREAVFNVNLQNTGRVRLFPSVTVGESLAEGPTLLLSRSVESYVAMVKIPWYGGRIKAPIVARTDSGLIRRVDASFVVIPWMLIGILGAVGGAGFALYKWWGRRGSKLAQLRADIRRLEALIAQRPQAATPSIDLEAEDEDEAGIIIAGIKRARRSNSAASLAKLAIALHNTGTDALDELMEALQLGGDAADGSLTGLLAAYSPERVTSHVRYGKLSDVSRQRLDAAMSRGTRENAGNNHAVSASTDAPKTRSKAPVRSGAATPKKPTRSSRKPVSPKHKPK